MEITNFFKTTKASYASKYSKRNVDTLLNKERSADRIQIKQNKIKGDIECKYLGNIGNYSEESSDEEILKKEIKKQVKLDAFIEKISQEIPNTCDIKHYKTNYTCLNEINDSPTNFNQLSSTENLNSPMDSRLDNRHDLNFKLDSGTSELLKNVQDRSIQAEDTSTSKYLNQQFSDYFENRYSIFEGMNKDNRYKTKDTETYNYEKNLDYQFPECLNIDETSSKKTKNLNFECSKEERLSNLIENLKENRSGNNTGDVKNILTSLKNLKPILKESSLFSRVPSVYSMDLCSETSDGEIDNKENELIETKIAFDNVAEDQKFFECLTEKFNSSSQFSNDQNITRNSDEADKYLQKGNLITSTENNDTILQKYSPIPDFIEYRGSYNRTKFGNNKINHLTVDNDSNFTTKMVNFDENVCINPKTITEDLTTDSFRDFRNQQSLEIPQIFSSKQFIEGNSPVFEDTNNTDTLCTNSLVVTGENMLNDEEIYGFLSKGYEKHLKKQELFDASSYVSRIEKLTQQIPLSRSNNEKCCVKQYRKGKTRIYRLKKLKKLQSKSSDPEIKGEFGIEDVLKHITQSFIHPETQFTKSDSCSSISTSSSYITDDGKSEWSTDSVELNEPQQTLHTQLNKMLRKEKWLVNETSNIYYENEKNYVWTKIQNIFLRVYDDFTKERSSYLKYRRQNFENCMFKDGRLQFKPLNECTTSVIKSNAKNSQQRFKLILYVMNKIQILLETNTKLTKRELYYQLKDVIKKQAVVDRTINVVSCILDTGMWALNILAQKGLVYGELKILMSNGATINCNIPGTSIPNDINDIIELQSTASFILVVEKEAIFHKLIEEDLPTKLAKTFIMITGKGFPDLNTQLFLRKLWIVMALPIFILVDADPHGLQIMLNYRFGSVHNAHVSQHLAVPNAKWLGIYPSEIKEFDMKTQPLTTRELKLIDQLLKTPYMNENPDIVFELNVLLENKYKAGIEGLIKSQIFLSEVYLVTKFVTNKFIS